MPIWFLLPQVMATMTTPIAMIASSCHRLVWIAWPKCFQPLQPSGQGSFRVPVT
jgi:hypothetical protein